MVKFWEWIWIGLILAITALDIVLGKVYPKGTLSARIWDAEGIGGRFTGNWSLLRFGVLIFLVWAILHLVFKVTVR